MIAQFQANIAFQTSIIIASLLDKYFKDMSIKYVKKNDATMWTFVNIIR